MLKHDPVVTTEDPRFPSGPWTGFYLDPHQPGRHKMDLDLTFTRGKISGSGDDSVGAFTVYGRYSDDGECVWNKDYATHSVAYRGFREGKGIWGTWEITAPGQKVRGGFQIWPRGLGDGAGEKIEEAVPVPAVLAGTTG